MASDQRMETAKRIAARIEHMVNADIAAIRGRLILMGMQPAHMEIYFSALTRASLREECEQAAKKEPPHAR